MRVTYLPDEAKMRACGFWPVWSHEPGQNNIYFQSHESVAHEPFLTLLTKGRRHIYVTPTDGNVTLVDVDESAFEFVLPGEAFFDELLYATGFAPAPELLTEQVLARLGFDYRDPGGDEPYTWSRQGVDIWQTNNERWVIDELDQAGIRHELHYVHELARYFTARFLPW
jgi:hypothetical protein